MKDYGKLIDGNLINFKQPIRTSDGDIFTNDQGIITQYGYKKIVYTEPPEAPEGYYPEPKWTETDTQIVQEWEFIPLPPEEATDEEYLSALEKMGVELND